MSIDTATQQALLTAHEQRNADAFWNSWSQLSARDSAWGRHTFLSDHPAMSAWVEETRHLTQRQEELHQAVDTQDPGTMYDWVRRNAPVRFEAFEAIERHMNGPAERVQEEAVAVWLPHLHPDDLVELFPTLIDYTEGYTCEEGVQRSLERLLGLTPPSLRLGSLCDTLDKVAADNAREWAEHLAQVFGNDLKAAPQDFYNSALVNAVSNDSWAMVGWLLGQGADLATGLHNHIKEGRLDEVEFDEVLEDVSTERLAAVFEVLRKVELEPAEACPRAWARRTAIERHGASASAEPTQTQRSRHRP